MSREELRLEALKLAYEMNRGRKAPDSPRTPPYKLLDLTDYMAAAEEILAWMEGEL